MTEVVPYIGTWIETKKGNKSEQHKGVVPYIGTWIETMIVKGNVIPTYGRTLYRYVD